MLLIDLVCLIELLNAYAPFRKLVAYYVSDEIHDRFRILKFKHMGNKCYK